MADKEASDSIGVVVEDVGLAAMPTWWRTTGPSIV